jgi:hypothetical protein
LTGTPLAHLRKRGQWARLRYSQALIEGISLREAARRCSVDKYTAFLWRHRFLRLAAGHRAEQIPVLVVRDRSGQTADFKLAKLDAPHVIAVLQPLIAQDAILCTESAGVYAVFARIVGIAHRQINIRQGRRVVEGALHIQNLNAYDSRLKGWMRRLHGVATKHLEDYLAWQRMLERYRNTINPAVCLGEALGRPVMQQLI